MLDDLGNIGDFVGGIAVVATMVYLAVQIRQNTQAMRSNEKRLMAELTQDRSALLVELQMALATTPDLAELMAKVDKATTLEEGIDALSPGERIRYMRYYLACWNFLDAQVYIFDAGLLDDEIFHNNIRSSLRTFYPNWKALGLLDRLGGRPGFKRMLEEIEKEGTADRHTFGPTIGTPSD